MADTARSSKKAAYEAQQAPLGNTSQRRQKSLEEVEIPDRYPEYTWLGIQPPLERPVTWRED